MTPHRLSLRLLGAATLEHAYVLVLPLDFLRRGMSCRSVWNVAVPAFNLPSASQAGAPARPHPGFAAATRLTVAAVPASADHLSGRAG